MRSRMLALALGASAAVGLSSPAQADMILSQVVVDLWPDKPPRDDIEVWNDGEERMYVSADPFEIRAPGKPEEQRVPAGLPEESGILVSPQRLILEPGERRTIRVAAIGDRSETDRVYRVAIRPVSGPISADASALKVFVGYDALVIVRPEQAAGDVAGERNGRTLRLVNAGNTAKELFDGRQCDSAGANCQTLPAKRLYPGAVWEQTLPYDTEVTYRTAAGSEMRERRF